MLNIEIKMGNTCILQNATFTIPAAKAPQLNVPMSFGMDINLKSEKVELVTQCLFLRKLNKAIARANAF